MKVLVTGHQGYLGTVMVPVLAAAGHEVSGLDNGLFAECVLGPLPAEPPALHRDLRDVEVGELAGFDAVVHLAALSNDPLGNLAPDITYEINHRAASRLARLARDAGVRRFLYASTCSVYGASGNAGLVTEGAPLAPVTPYAESKVRVEDDLHDIADEHFEPVYLRNATAFGFSPRLRGDIVLNDLVASAVLTNEVRVLSDGTPWRPLAHARDIAAAFLACLEAPREAVHDTAFNVGMAANNLRVSEIAAIVAEAVPGAEVVITGEAGNDPRSYRVDFARITERVPGFVPEWTVQRGAEELRDRYREYGLTAEEFRNRFVRLRWLAARQAAGAIDDQMHTV